MFKFNQVRFINKDDMREGQAATSGAPSRRLVGMLVDQRFRDMRETIIDRILLMASHLNVQNASRYVFSKPHEDDVSRWVLARYLDMYGTDMWASEVARRHMPKMKMVKESVVALEKYLSDVEWEEDDGKEDGKEG